MLNLASDRALESKYKPVPLEEGLIFSKRIDDNNVIRDMCDQDMIHNHKKLINSLDQIRRDLQCGNYPVHMNYVRLVLVTQPNDARLKLRRTDVDRVDRQNWAACQRLSSLSTQNTLLRISTGQILDVHTAA